MTTAADNILLLGCGILRKEISFLIEKRGWPIDTYFLDSALHIDLDGLALQLRSGLDCNKERRTIVFYGACHPLMDQVLAGAGTIRTGGQNCVEMLMGEENFSGELERGAFFMLEDWALRWEDIVTRTFGKNLEVIRDIFREGHRYLLCLRTPCSGDFAGAAEKAGKMVGLPLRWQDVSLDHLEAVLAETMERKIWSE